MSETEVSITIGDLKSEIQNDIYANQKEIKISKIVMAVMICIVSTSLIVIFASSVYALNASSDYVGSENVGLLKSAILVSVWAGILALTGIIVMVGCIVLEKIYMQEMEALSLASTKLTGIDHSDSTFVTKEMIRDLFVTNV